LERADGILVLDNCEHLSWAVERCVRRLLDDCPRLTVVITSRARLGAGYEWVYELPGLDTDDGVLLFRTRAEAAGGVVPDEPTVAMLCADLDGMALAIELAAARYPSLGLDGLAAGLKDPLHLLGSEDGARQRSLRATITWSVDLLGGDERAVFAACSVFASGFTVAAARCVAWPDHSDAEVARLLANLSEQHLVRPVIGSPTTYRYQEVVRQYAQELLGPGATSAHVRHAQWAASELTACGSSAHDDAWCQVFDLLSIEINAALGRGVFPLGPGELFAEQLVLRGRPEEAQRLFEAMAATEETDRPRLLRLAATVAAARLVGNETIRLLDEACVAAVASGDEGAAAEALAWSVIHARMYPGSMADPPTVGVTQGRLAEALRRAPVGSRAEATVAAAAATLLEDDDPAAGPAALGAANVAAAAHLPVVAAAALDKLCSTQLLRWEYAEGLATVAARGALLEPLPVDAETAFAFNDYLLMGCEVSLSAGDLPGAAAYADRLLGLPCYRDYAYPALARRLEVDVLAGDLTAATSRGEEFLTSWERAGRSSASTLAVGPYAVALAHGLLGDDDGRQRWRDIAARLVAGGWASLDGLRTGWAPTFDGWLHLDRGQPDAANTILSVDPDDRLWASWNTALWRPWYAAAWAEASAMVGAPDLGRRLSRAARATRDNPVATALVRRAAALAAGDLESMAHLAATLDGLGAAYQRDRTLRLARSGST
jgi:hypothetical protein